MTIEVTHAPLTVGNETVDIWSIIDTHTGISADIVDYGEVREGHRWGAKVFPLYGTEIASSWFNTAPEAIAWAEEVLLSICKTCGARQDLIVEFAPRDDRCGHCTAEIPSRTAGDTDGDADTRGAL